MSRHCSGVNRRDFVRVGALSAFGVGVGHAPTGLQAAGSSSPAAKRCVLIWLDGGPSHLETFDPKPAAPKEVRGPFAAISTQVPGTHISEVLPQTAKIADRFAIVRSVTSPLGEHNLGTQYLLTGYKPTPVLEYPTYGAVLGHVRKYRGVLPGHVAVPTLRVGGSKLTGHGFLPAEQRPFAVGGDRSFLLAWLAQAAGSRGACRLHLRCDRCTGKLWRTAAGDPRHPACRSTRAVNGAGYSGALQA